MLGFLFDAHRHFRFLLSSINSSHDLSIYELRCLVHSRLGRQSNPLNFKVEEETQRRLDRLGEPCSPHYPSSPAYLAAADRDVSVWGAGKRAPES